MDGQFLSRIAQEAFDAAEGDRRILEIKQRARVKRGRGFELNSVTARDQRSPAFRRYDKTSSDSDYENEFRPQRSVEGWILFVRNIHEEAEESDVMAEFEEYGMVKNLHLNLDRRTGFLKGYALVEYETYVEALAAKEAKNNAQFLGLTIKVDWAFSKTPFRIQTYLSRHRKRKHT